MPTGLDIAMISSNLSKPAYLLILLTSSMRSISGIFGIMLLILSISLCIMLTASDGHVLLIRFRFMEPMTLVSIHCLKGVDTSSLPLAISLWSPGL